MDGRRCKIRPQVVQGLDSAGERRTRFEHNLRGKPAATFSRSCSDNAEVDHAKTMNEPRLNLPELTVSELSAALKRTIEDAYGYVRVRGELGKVSYHGNGHVYFDLKDERACISGVIWRSATPRIKLKLEAGLEVVITGRLTTYPGRSQYQIIVETLEPAGLGALMALLEERKRKTDRRGIVRRGKEAAPAVSARRHRCHHVAKRCGHPRHPAPARRPFSAPRAGVAGESAGRRFGGRGRRRDRRVQCAAGARPDAAARPFDRRARRRLARGPLVVQRRDRGARGGRQPDPADLRGRPRDRRDADRFCRRSPRADADGGRRDGGAGACGTCGRRPEPRAACARRLVAQSGSAAGRGAFRRSRAPGRRRGAGAAAAAARSCRRGIGAGASRQRPSPSREPSCASAGG